jgi:hypothetical protein
LKFNALDRYIQGRINKSTDLHALLSVDRGVIFGFRPIHLYVLSQASVNVKYQCPKPVNAFWNRALGILFDIYLGGKY